MNATRSDRTGPRKRPKANQHVTKSGKVIKLHQSLGDRMRARREARARSKAAYLSTLPQGRVKRILYRLHPKRVAKYWFSREGAIMAVKIVGIGTVVMFIIVSAVFAYFRKDLRSVLDASGSSLGGSNRYYDKTGEVLLWEDFDAIKRIPVNDDQISQYVKDATIAIEDRDFYKHGGFNLRGITRAAVNNVLGRSTTQGGSTLTQQLVKITQNYTEERTYTRKIKELILAIELERTNEKKDILAGYLNSAPYGGIEVGVEAGAQSYFNKSAKDLTLDEAAMLAAIPKSPTYYAPSPTNSAFDRGALIGRQHYILDVMVEMDMVKEEEAEAAKAVDVLAKVQPKKPKYENIKAPYFVLAAKEALEAKYTEKTVKRGGWKVITTLDMNLQQIAEDEVSKGIRQVRRQGGDTAAFVAEDVKTGQVVAMVGGPDFNDKDRAGEVNFATQPLQPGSSVKPYTYATLMNTSDKFGAGSVLFDTQGALEGYPCTNKALPPRGNCLHNYSRQYSGPITIRYALGASLNVPAVKAMLIATPAKVQETVEKIGVASGYKCYLPGTKVGIKENETACGGAAGIGDGAYIRLDQHVHGYSTLSRNGRNIPHTYILKIEDSGGKVVDEWKPATGEQTIRADAAYITADMMADPNASFFSRKIHRYKNHKFSIKTGTTGDNRDAWMMGFSTQYAVGVWTGHHTNSVSMSGISDTMTQPIWNGFMTRAHDNLKPEDREKPAGVQTLPAYVFTKKIYGNIPPSPSTDLYPSWYAGNKKADNRKKIVDKVSGKLATDCTPERAKEEISETNANSFSGDPFVNNSQGFNTDEKDDIHRCEDARPTISLSISDLGGGKYRLTAVVAPGTHPLSSDKFAGNVSFRIGDQILPGGSFQVDSAGAISFDYLAEEDGNRSVIAEVVDSVLYDASDTEAYTFSAVSSASFNLNKTAQAGALATFSWDSVAGATSYEICYQKVSGVNNGSTKCEAKGGATAGTITLTHGNGDYSVTVNSTPVIRSTNSVTISL